MTPQVPAARASLSIRDCLASAVLGLVVALVGVLTVAVDPWLGLEEWVGLQWLFALRGPVQAPDNVVVVAMDEESTLALQPETSQQRDRMQGWPRSLHAELVQYLARAGARVICFDLTFETAREQNSDKAFADAIKQAGNVGMAAAVRRNTSAGGHLMESVVLPLDLLGEGAAARAPFLLPKEPRVSAYWSFYDGATGVVPTLPVACLQVQEIEALGDLLATVRTISRPGSASEPVDASHLLGLDDGSRGVADLRKTLGDPAAYAKLLARLDDPSEPKRTESRKRTLRILARLYASEGTIYLNFYGPPRTVDTVPYHRVIQAARSARAASSALDFRGKSIFIGYSAATQPEQDRLRDSYPSVYSTPGGLDLSGVEIVATAFANLEQDRVLRQLAAPWAWTLVAGWGLVLGMLGGRLRPASATVVCVVLLAIYFAIAYERFVDAALWIPLAIPAGVQAPLAVILGLWLRYRGTNRERMAIRRGVGYYLPTTIVDQLAESIGPVTRTNRVVFGACLATDVEAYTSLAESMAPGGLGELMNAYYAQLFKPVERHGGVVVDVVGDAMIAIWASPSSDEQLRLSACLAALEALDALTECSGSTPEAPGLSTRFGLHAGDMLVGSIGGASHYEFRAVGDIVNTASRIQGLNKVLGTRLLASEDSVRGLDRLAVRPLGSFLLPGKSNEVSIVELLGLRQNVGAAATSLFASFGTALALYRAGRLDAAREAFAAMTAVAPGDGPTRFYLQRCDVEASAAVDAEWSGVIRIGSK